MLTPEQYQAFRDAMEELDKWIEEHPEIIEEAVHKYVEQFVDVKDVALGDKVSFLTENPMKNVKTKSLPTKMIFEDKNSLDCKDYKRDAQDGGYYG